MHVYSNYYKKIFYFFSSQSIRTTGNSINFDDKKIKKSDFYKNKKIFNINDIDVNNILVSKKEKYGKYNSFKRFIGYNDYDVIKPLYLELSQMIGYINKFDKNTITMSLKVKDKKLFKNNNKIWKKIEKSMEIDLHQTYVNKEDNITTNLYNKKWSKKYQKKKYHINVYQ